MKTQAIAPFKWRYAVFISFVAVLHCQGVSVNSHSIKLEISQIWLYSFSTVNCPSPCVSTTVIAQWRNGTQTSVGVKYFDDWYSTTASQFDVNFSDEDGYPTFLFTSVNKASMQIFTLPSNSTDVPDDGRSKPASIKLTNNVNSNSLKLIVTVTCQSNRKGRNCDECTSVNRWGPLCDKQCACTMGVCSNGPRGNGDCMSCLSTDVFGPLCNNTCTCQNGNCSAGITGTGKCTDPCPARTYGPNCMACACPSTSICNTNTGACTCPPNKYGANCTETGNSLAEGSAASNTKGGSASVGPIVGGVIGAIVCVGAVAGLLVWHRRRAGGGDGVGLTSAASWKNKSVFSTSKLSKGLGGADDAEAAQGELFHNPMRQNSADALISDRKPASRDHEMSALSDTADRKSHVPAGYATLQAARAYDSPISRKKTDEVLYDKSYAQVRRPAHADGGLNYADVAVGSTNDDEGGYERPVRHKLSGEDDAVDYTMVRAGKKGSV
eukprot:Opistho-2@62481